MITKLNSCGLVGIDGYIVNVETDISNGMPSFDIVGLPDTAVKESKERIRAALKNSGVPLGSKRIVVNLAPADVKKEGAYFDLPIAIGLLTALEHFTINDVNEYVFLGELSLDGDLRHVTGTLPMVISAYQRGIKKIVLPLSNAKEAAVIGEIEVYGANNLREIIEHFTQQIKLKRTVVNTDKLFQKAQHTQYDFANVKGQENVKRALEVAAAGGHNCLLIGPPGCGKTMLAQSLPSILPDMTFDEALEVTKIHSISGNLHSNYPMIFSRPFRSPHHTISAVGLSGGGSRPKPGEISLSHNGVLFLDELPEFRKDVLEVMRQPLEDGVVTISRVSGTLSYPCNIMLIAAMNPCPCGYYGDITHQCSCGQEKIKHYLNRVSGPLLDRIDLHVEVPAVTYQELTNSTSNESSANIKKRAYEARLIQLERFKDSRFYSNSRLTSDMIAKFCSLGSEERQLLKQAFDNLGLSARAHNRILKVARTIADLDKSNNIQISHLAEAIQYRSLDRKFWSSS